MTHVRPEVTVEMRVKEAALIEKRPPKRESIRQNQMNARTPKKQSGGQHRRHHRSDGSWQKDTSAIKEVINFLQTQRLF